jgi:hypothetical protein
MEVQKAHNLCLEKRKKEKSLIEQGYRAKLDKIVAEFEMASKDNPNDNQMQMNTACIKTLSNHFQEGSLAGYLVDNFSDRLDREISTAFQDKLDPCYQAHMVFHIIIQFSNQVVRKDENSCVKILEENIHPFIGSLANENYLECKE